MYHGEPPIDVAAPQELFGCLPAQVHTGVRRALLGSLQVGIRGFRTAPAIRERIGEADAKSDRIEVRRGVAQLEGGPVYWTFDICSRRLAASVDSPSVA